MEDQQEFTVKRVKRQTLNRTVYEAIKHSILKGDIPAGAKLSEVQMGKQLGVSATPVREAFRMLSMEGLIQIDPWKGAVVQGFSKQAALENCQCREALELLALRLFMKKMTEKELDALRYMIHAARTTTDISEFVRTSSAIHDVWIKGSGNSKLQLMIGQLSTVTLRERNVSASDNLRRAEIIKEHARLLEALESRDTARAEEVLSSHIRKGFEYSLKQTEKE